ncbi:ferritin heavy chain-like [Urocitellus parryii]
MNPMPDNPYEDMKTPPPLPGSTPPLPACLPPRSDPPRPRHRPPPQAPPSVTLAAPRGPRRRYRGRRRCPLRSPRARSALAFVVAPLLPAPVMVPIVVSQVRHNYHPDCEAAVNSQIQVQLHASYVYLSLAFFCHRLQVALEHFASFFLRLSHEWRDRAEKLMELQNQRGGHIRLRDVEQPERSAWHSGLQAMECAFHLEKSLNQGLLELHHLAAERGDPHLCQFLQRHYLHQQVLTIRELAGYLTNLRRIQTLEDPMAEILFDRLTLGRSCKDD